MQALTNIQYELFMVLSTVGLLNVTLTLMSFEITAKNWELHDTDALMDMFGDLLSNCTEHVVIHGPCSERTTTPFTSSPAG